MFCLSDYDYTLPEELIAQHPTLPPENARLLVYNRTTETRDDKHFYDLPDLLDPGTLIVFNDSKVVKARLLFPEFNGELLFLRSLGTTSCEALVRPGKKRKVGMTHTIQGTTTSFTVTETTHEGRIITCSDPVLEVLEKYGQMPLPPYITYTKEDAPHYQPIVANEQKLGSVAAPTAALHFSDQLLAQFEKKGIHKTMVTLHVGIGTFKTVDVEDITAYSIHDELCEIPVSLFSTIAQQKSKQKPLLSIGTTSTRTLESLPYLRKQYSEQQKRDSTDTETKIYWDDLTKDISSEQAKKYVSNIVTDDGNTLFHCTLYIYPGFTFKVIDQLITNFHLPKSSLLMLVAGYIGFEKMKALYAHALQKKYRFFSFGDGMLIT